MGQRQLGGQRQTAGVSVQHTEVAECEWHPQMFFTCPAWPESRCLFA